MAEAEIHFHGLEIQGVAARTIPENISKSEIKIWNDVLELLPEFLFQFTRKALQQQLPTASNLARWKRIADPTCSLCPGAKPQTNKHPLSNFSNPLMLEQYLKRHNEILKLVSTWIDLNKSPAQQLFTDIDSGNQIGEVFHDTVRPDLVIASNATIVILELTVCHESNLVSSKTDKLNKYKNIAAHRRDQ